MFYIWGKSIMCYTSSLCWYKTIYPWIYWPFVLLLLMKMILQELLVMFYSLFHSSWRNATSHVYFNLLIFTPSSALVSQTTHHASVRRNTSVTHYIYTVEYIQVQHISNSIIFRTLIWGFVMHTFSLEADAVNNVVSFVYLVLLTSELHFRLCFFTMLINP